MRLALTRQSGLAITALRVLARRDARTPAARLAAAVGTTTSFLPKIMFPLVRQGWVKSASGPGGGYELSADPAGISVLEVIEAVDGPLDSRGCLVPPPPLPDDDCPFHEGWKRAKHALLAELRELRVTDGLDPPLAAVSLSPPALQKQKGTPQ